MMYNGNLKFVVGVAMTYKNQGVELMDLIQAGNLGLAIAIGDYDMDNHQKLISYAVWWIRQKILEELAHYSRCMKVPATEITTNCTVKDAKNELYKKLGRTPSDEEIVKSSKKLRKKSLNRISNIEQNISLNTKIKIHVNGQPTELLGLIKDNTTMSPDSFHLANIEEKIIDFLDKAEAQRKINNMEKDVVKMTYGIEYGVPYTLDEIREKYNMGGREQARVKNLRALKKLKLFSQDQRLRNKKHLSMDMILT